MKKPVKRNKECDRNGECDDEAVQDKSVMLEDCM